MLCNLVGEWIPQRTTTKSQFNESSGLKSSMLLDTRKPVRIETPIYSTVMTFLGVKKWLSLKVTNSCSKILICLLFKLLTLRNKKSTCWSLIQTPRLTNSPMPILMTIWSSIASRYWTPAKDRYLWI